MVVVVDLAGRPNFFIRVNVGLNIALAINEAVLTGADVAVSFSGFF